MAELKTKANARSVADFLESVDRPVRRADAETVVALMQSISDAPPVMWGPSIIGFGRYHYKYESGHEGDICKIGFSPRKAQLVFYILSGDPQQEDQLARLGKYKRGKGCLYINKLADIDMAVLEQMIATAWSSENPLG